MGVPGVGCLCLVPADSNYDCCVLYREKNTVQMRIHTAVVGRKKVFGIVADKRASIGGR